MHTQSRVYTITVTVVSVGRRQRLLYGGNDERRILRPPTSDSYAFGRSIRYANLPCAETLTGLISQVVEPLSRVRPRWTVRSDSSQSPSRATHPTRVGASDSDYSTSAGSSHATRHTLPPDRGEHDSGRTQDVAHSPFAVCPHGGARIATQWDHITQSTARAEWTRSWRSWSSAGKSWADPCMCSSTMSENWRAGARQLVTCPE